MSSHKYLCEFRGRCPAFDKENMVCTEKPWMCNNWKTHIENVKKGKKPITDARDFKLTDYVGRPDIRAERDPDDDYFRELNRRMRRDTYTHEDDSNAPEEKVRKSSPYFKGQLKKKSTSEK